MQAIIFSIVLGILIASIGAYKDTLWETFSWRAFIRTPTICFLWGFILSYIFQDSSWILLGLSAVALERLSVEVWKGIFRKMPSKFKTPHRDTKWLKSRLKRV